MEFERNLLEILSIIIIITFLKRKTNISENDLLTLILINIFIFIIYDYLSLNKSCPKTESFSNSEPCNIKDIEKMFNKYVSTKKEKFSDLESASKPTKKNNESVSPEDELDDLIEQINGKEISVEGETQEEQDYVQPPELQETTVEEEVKVPVEEEVRVPVEEEARVPVEDEFHTIDTSVHQMEIDDVIAEYEAEKQKAVRTSVCAKSDWSDIANTYSNSSASYPNIFSDNPTLSYPNYETEKVTCSKINKNTSLPNDHTNEIKALKKETTKEKALKNKLWSCQRKLKQCS